MPYNTNNPVPSSDLRDFGDNSLTFDEVINSNSNEVITRTGKKRLTLKGFEGEMVQISESANQSAQDAKKYAEEAQMAALKIDKGLSYFSARMAAGYAVKFAWYGDSTVDGFATTGWTANPVSGGNAVGNSNHNTTSPNSCAVKLEAILREIFNNSSIAVFNAGYAGKSLADGWAYQNYDAAITNNPYYGTPDITFIEFGLNDARPAGAQIDDFKAEAERLALKIINNGTLPVFLSSDPILRNYNATNAVYNREITTQIEQAKKDTCRKLGIPYIDKSQDLINWISNNKDGYQWMVEQSTDSDGNGVYDSGDDVGLHFRDNGHALKAQVVASQLFPDVIFYDGGCETITSADSRANAFGNFLTTLNGTSGPNNKQGFAFKVNYYDQNAANRPAGPLSPMSTLWVFNRNPNAYLIYRGLVGEGWGVDNPDNSSAVPTVEAGAPRVSIKNLTTGSEKVSIPAAVGWRYSGFYKTSDVPYKCGKLPIGLIKITYLCGDFRQYNDGSNSIFFYGYFDIRENHNALGTISCLKNTGEILQSFISTDKKMVLLPEQDDCSNIYSIMGLDDAYPKNTVEFYVDATIPLGSGVVLGHTSSFGGIASGNPDHYGARTATVLYRNASDKVRTMLVKQDTDGDVITVFRTAQSSSIAFSTDRVKLKVSIKRDFSANNQVVTIYDASGASVSTSTLSYSDLPLHFAGVAGGLFWDGSVAGNGTAILHSLNVVKS